MKQSGLDRECGQTGPEEYYLGTRIIGHPLPAPRDSTGGLQCTEARRAPLQYCAGNDPDLVYSVQFREASISWN